MLVSRAIKNPHWWPVNSPPLWGPVGIDLGVVV
jgi:hypothetical protein